MPVQRFRTFEEARRALWTAAGDATILERLQRLGELGRSHPARRGVFRYRTIEEAKQEKHATGDAPPDEPA
jgi:hypothetical protein